jgi:hypothetical protein
MFRRRKKDPLRFMLMAAKARSKKNNLPFNISKEDLFIPEYCPILNIELKHNEGIFKDNSPTLDRIVPSKGYTKGNVRIISHRANLLKNNMNMDECRLLLKDFENVQVN